MEKDRAGRNDTTVIRRHLAPLAIHAGNPRMRERAAIDAHNVTDLDRLSAVATTVLINGATRPSQSPKRRYPRARALRIASVSGGQMKTRSPTKIGRLGLTIRHKPRARWV